PMPPPPAPWEGCDSLVSTVTSPDRNRNLPASQYRTWSGTSVQTIICIASPTTWCEITRGPLSRSATARVGAAASLRRQLQHRDRTGLHPDAAQALEVSLAE